MVNNVFENTTHVNGTLVNNANVLQEEIKWLVKVFDTRLKIHFGHDCEYNDVSEITPPAHYSVNSYYADFIKHYNLSFEERVILALSLIPHIKPELLDVFLSNNSTTGLGFTEFGGVRNLSQPGFLPTGTTAIFVLAGEDLAKKFSCYKFFEAGHYFARHNILSLEAINAGEPYLNGVLKISKEFVDFFTTGYVQKPNFGIDFPARLINTSFEWDDLVLERLTSDQIMEIKTWIDYKDVLMNDWGLGIKLKPGYRSLFYGPPGTGKTLTACLLGKITGKDVYRIDLSTVVSKYIGETEKNLEKIFNQAEHKNWILFFDEADALFGKRTNISDAHDKFANQEVSYLLQRVEDFDGVVILSSNYKSNLDEAFTRRFQSIIHFPMPSQGERLKLWENSFSKINTFENDIDFEEISARYELSGGAIMNVIRYTSLMSLKRGSTQIKLSELEEGIRREYQKEGKTF